MANNISIPLTYTPISPYNLMSNYIPYQNIYTSYTPTPMQSLISLLPQNWSTILSIAQMFIPELANLLPTTAIKVTPNTFDLTRRLFMQKYSQLNAALVQKALETDMHQITHYISKYWYKGKLTEEQQKVASTLGTIGAFVQLFTGMELIPGGSNIRAAMMALDIGRTLIQPGRFFAGIRPEYIKNLQTRIFHEMEREVSEGKFDFTFGLNKMLVSNITRELAARGIFRTELVGGPINYDRIINIIKGWNQTFKGLSDIFGSKDFNELFKTLQDITGGQFTAIAPNILQTQLRRIGYLSSSLGIQPGFIRNFIAAINRSYQSLGFGRVGLTLGVTAISMAHMVPMRGLGGTVIAPMQLASRFTEEQMRILSSPLSLNDEAIRLAAYAEAIGGITFDRTKLFSTNPEERNRELIRLRQSLISKVGSEQQLQSELANMDIRMITNYISDRQDVQLYLNNKYTRMLPYTVAQALNPIIKYINTLKDPEQRIRFVQALSSVKTIDDIDKLIKTQRIDTSILSRADLAKYFRVRNTSRFSDRMNTYLLGMVRSEYARLEKQWGPMQQTLEEVVRQYWADFSSPIPVIGRIISDIREGDIGSAILHSLGYETFEDVIQRGENIIRNMDITEKEKKLRLQQFRTFISELDINKSDEAEELRQLQKELETARTESERREIRRKMGKITGTLAAKYRAAESIGILIATTPLGEETHLRSFMAATTLIDELNELGISLNDQEIRELMITEDMDTYVEQLVKKKGYTSKMERVREILLKLPALTQKQWGIMTIEGQTLYKPLVMYETLRTHKRLLPIFFRETGHMTEQQIREIMSLADTQQKQKDKTEKGADKGHMKISGTLKIIMGNEIRQGEIEGTMTSIEKETTKSIKGR